MDIQDPLREIHKISGPMYVSAYTKDKKRLLFLADSHFSKHGLCKSCKYPECATVPTLLQKLEAWHKQQDTDLDVFLEAWTGMRPHPTKFEKYMRNASFHKILDFQRQSKINGPLIETVEQYYDRLFHHKNEPSIRFHYLDIRNMLFFTKYGFDVNRVAEIYFTPIHGVRGTLEFELRRDFYTLYPTKKEYLHAIDQLCFSNKFSLKAKSNTWKAVIPDSLFLSKGMTKIAKQFYKLPREYHAPIRSYILKKFGNLWNPKHKLADFTVNHYDDYKCVSSLCVKKDAVFYEKVKEDNFVDFYLTVVSSLTDVYAFCRALYYFLQQPEGSTTVFYAGYIHAINYETFFHEILNTKRVSGMKQSQLIKTLKLDTTDMMRCMEFDF